MEKVIQPGKMNQTCKKKRYSTRHVYAFQTFGLALFTLLMLFITDSFRVDVTAAPASASVVAPSLKDYANSIKVVRQGAPAEKIEWGTLANVRWEWKDNFYEATFNEQQKALDGKEVEIEGFMFPLEYTRKHQTFLVSASPMSNCFFCGPGEAESMVYVLVDEAVDFTNRPVTVKGTFRLVSDASMGIIYQLDNAMMVQ